MLKTCKNFPNRICFIDFIFTIKSQENTLSNLKSTTRFYTISDVNVKKGIFVIPHLRELMKDLNSINMLNQTEEISFVEVCDNSLEIKNCQKIIQHFFICRNL